MLHRSYLPRVLVAALKGGSNSQAHCSSPVFLPALVPAHFPFALASAPTCYLHQPATLDLEACRTMHVQVCVKQKRG